MDATTQPTTPPNETGTQEDFTVKVENPVGVLDIAANRRQARGTGFARGIEVYDANLTEPLTNYTKYEVPATTFLDMNELRARNQPLTEKWLRGSGKMLTTAGGAFVDGTAGIVAGMVESISKRDFSDFWNNSIGREVDSMNEWMQKNFPNYYTQQELNTKGLASMGYANFWADKVLNGVGYMLGTIGSTAGVLGAVKLVKGASTAVKMHKLTQAAVTGADAAKAMKGSTVLAKGLDATKTAMIGMTSAFAEASVEARETLRRTEQELLTEAAKSLGVPINQLSAEEKSRIKEEAKAAGNLAFALNSLVVGVGNIAAYRNLLIPKYADARLGMQGISRNAKTGLWEETISKMSPGRRAWSNLGKPMARGAVIESFQESSQFAIQEQAREMSTAGSVSEMFDAWGQGYVDTFSSKEGIDSTLVGAIVGILGGGAGAVRRHYTKAGREATAAQTTRRDEIIKILNNPDLFNIMQRAEAAQGSINLAARMQTALENGDHKTYRDLQVQLLANEVLTHSDAGRLDLLFDKLDEELTKTDEQFRENWGIPESVPLDKGKYVNGLKNRIKQFVDLKNKIDARYAAPTKPGKNATAEEKENYLVQQAEFNFLRNRLLNASFSIEDIDSRIDNLSIELNDLGKVGLTEKDATEEDTQALIEKLNKAYEEVEKTNPQNKEEFLEKARDFIRLTEDRAAAVSTVNELTAAPEQRELFLNTLKAREDAAAQAERDEIAREKIAKANTTKDLQDILDNESEENKLSPAVKTEVENKRDSITQRTREEITESRFMSVEELKVERDETNDAVRKAILTDIIDRRTELGQLEPLRKRKEEETPPAPKAEEKKKPEEPKQPEEKEKPAPDEVTGAEETTEAAAEDFETTTKATASDFEGAEEAEEGDAMFGEDRPATEEDKNRHRENRKAAGGISVANGEVKTKGRSGKYKVVVSEEGDITTGNDSNQKEPDGTPLNINRQLLKDLPEDEVIGMGVKLRVIETEWSSKNETDETNQPIGIYAQTAEGEVLIGMVKAGKGAERAAIVRGEITDGVIKNVHAGNIISTVNKQGEPVFFPVNEAIGEADVLIGAVRTDGSILVSERLEDDDMDKADAVSDISEVEASPGRVALISTRPGVGLGVKMANTANMDTQAVEAIKALLQQNTDTLAADIRDIVALTNNQDPGTIFYVQKEQEVNARVYFKHANGDLVRITNEELAKALRGESYIFSVGEMLPLTAEVDGETIPLTDALGEVKFRFRSKFDPNEEGLSEEERESLRKERAIYSNKMRAEMISSLEQSLINKKRQVDINKAYNNRAYTSPVTGVTYDTYLDYLSSPDELSEPQQDKTSILSVDGKTHNGSFYYDLKIDIDIFESTPEAAEETAAPTAKQDVKNAAPKPEANFSDILSGAAKAAGARRRPRGNAKAKGEETKTKCKKG